MNTSELKRQLLEERRLLARVEQLLGMPARRLWPVTIPLHEILVKVRYKARLNELPLLLLRTIALSETVSSAKLAQQTGIEPSPLQVALSGLEKAWGLISSTANGISLTRRGASVIERRGELPNSTRTFVFRFDALTGLPCHRIFYDPYVARRRAGIQFLRVPPIKNPTLENLQEVVTSTDELRFEHRIPAGVTEALELLSLIETIWVPSFVAEAADGTIATLVPQASFRLPSEHPMSQDPASMGCELNMEHQLSALNQELEQREMGDAVVRLGAGFPSLDVDPKWLRDRDTASSIERMWFSRSGLILPLRAREGGY